MDDLIKKWPIDDESLHGLGVVLVQVNPVDKNDHRIIWFASLLLTEIETKYSQCEKEGIVVFTILDVFVWQLVCIGDRQSSNTTDFRQQLDNRQESSDWD